MELSIKILRNPLWVMLQIFILFVARSVAQSHFQAAVFCDRSQQSESNLHGSVLSQVMAMISQKINKTGWAVLHEPTLRSESDIFALGQCYGNLSPEECTDCFQLSKRELYQCLPAYSARAYLDGCFLRYDRYNFFKESVDNSYDMVECGTQMTISDDFFMENEFVKKVDNVLSNVTSTALKNLGFSVMGDRGGVEGVYALAQCWSSFDEEGCRSCFRRATYAIRGCLPGKEGRALYTGCYLRFSTERFYSVISDMDVGEEDFRIGFIIVGFLSLASLVLLAFFGARLGYMKLSKNKPEVNNIQIRISVHNSKLNFKYEVLEKATDSFDVTRKLGQGGAGSVFLGILSDDKAVAVKKLFFNTRQWADEFFNEVNLIGGIEHKNLVKLLGCSIEGPESLLVYEYVPNRSLDQILFAKDGNQILSWRQRFDIILGIAEGLAYLHEGCDVKVIHRDIKTSNILIDENFTPKIADFGLARCIASNKSHISTGIAGTLGYMAPEYLVKGQLTEKADIYAFGVMILEIACGRKNSVFTRGSNSILHSVWRQYKTDQITRSVDPDLESNFPEKEAANVLQIGLLCTQALVSLRPSMSEVVRMLTKEDSEIPSPRQPPFLNSSVFHAGDLSGSQASNTTDQIGNINSEASTFYSVESDSFSSNRN